MEYKDSEEYQKEIAEQYKKRTYVFSKEEVVQIMQNLGFNISPENIIQAESGNMHATYIIDGLVVKITKEKDKGYLANKVVSDHFPNEPVVHVLTHDVFNKNPYEVLVMEKSKGIILQKTMPKLDPEIITSLFLQILDIVEKCNTITSDTFGFVSDSEFKYKTFRELQTSRIKEYLQKIRIENLAHENDISHIENYFNKHSHVLDNEKAVLVHRDLHMGNILHVDDTLTAIIDWDSAQYVPFYVILRSILGMIDNPSQYVEGTPDFNEFKNINFHYLLPVLKERLPYLFNDPDLLLKLNLYGIVEGLMWVSQNWSEVWNKEMIAGLIKEETPGDLDLLNNSYYGKILSF